MALSSDLAEQAADSNLRIASPEDLPLRRRQHGRGFAYYDGNGRRITRRSTLDRIAALAIPPAYHDVRIAASDSDHLQAVGRDEAGRLQYIYHPGWEDVREARKVERLAALCEALPRIRRKVARVLGRPGVDRETALAAVIMLIDRTHIRIGCDDYVHSGRSRGATTLLKRNVRLDGDRVCIDFLGKRRRPVSCEISVPCFTAATSEMLKLPGSRLFQYRNGAGKIRPVRADEANAYLSEIAQVGVTAKDFRTLAATAAAAARFGSVEPAPAATRRRRQIAEVMREISEMLGNTPAVARRSYVHRRLVDAFAADELRRIFAKASARRGLTRGEAAVAALFSDGAAQCED